MILKNIISNSKSNGKEKSILASLFCYVKNSNYIKQIILKKVSDIMSLKAPAYISHTVLVHAGSYRDFLTKITTNLPDFFNPSPKDSKKSSKLNL